MGFLYVMTNPKMPNLYKVGYTYRELSERERELSSPTGVPGRFVTILAIYLDWAEQAERAIHQMYRPFRDFSNKEFFEIEEGLFGYFLDNVVTICIAIHSGCNINEAIATAGEYGITTGCDVIEDEDLYTVNNFGFDDSLIPNIRGKHPNQYCLLSAIEEASKKNTDN